MCRSGGGSTGEGGEKVGEDARRCRGRMGMTGGGQRKKRGDKRGGRQRKLGEVMAEAEKIRSARPVEGQLHCSAKSKKKRFCGAKIPPEIVLQNQCRDGSVEVLPAQDLQDKKPGGNGKWKEAYNKYVTRSLPMGTRAYYLQAEAGRR